jgi:hypothetical protein
MRSSEFVTYRAILVVKLMKKIPFLFLGVYCLLRQC